MNNILELYSSTKTADFVSNSTSDFFTIGTTILPDGDNPRFFYSENWTSGIYYFIAMAFNERGNRTSNTIYIEIQIPGLGPEELLPWWAYPIITGAISAVVGIIIKQAYSSIKKRRLKNIE
ncbi:MAG: hypothetical protein ACFFAS_10005 [Promethearchaeota archaeon]